MKWLMVIIGVSALLEGAEFLYPVAVLPGSHDLLLIYQKTPHHIELWQWNSKTFLAEHILLSRFTPAGLRLVPDKSGYSFIDNGRIRVKRWIKRSPATIELDAPISNIELIHWIDPQCLYTSGRFQGSFGIFHIDQEGTVCPVAWDQSMDYLYPYKIDQTVYAIERDEHRQYRIIAMPYDPYGADYMDFSDRIAEYTMGEREVILECGFQPIVFLRMSASNEGYFVSHPRAISKKDDSIQLSYNRLYKGEHGWQSERLFSYVVPTNLLFTGKPSRLYEALLPLIPYHAGSEIWYVDCGQRAYLGLYRYDLTTNISSCAYQNEGSHVLGPLQCGNRMIFGGEIRDDLPDAVHMKMSEHGIRILLGSLGA